MKGEAPFFQLRIYFMFSSLQFLLNIRHSRNPLNAMVNAMVNTMVMKTDRNVWHYLTFTELMCIEINQKPNQC